LALVLITGLGTPAFAGEVPEPDPITEPGGETISFEFGFLVTNVISDNGELTSTQEVVEEGIVIPITITFDADMPDQSSADDDGIYPYDKASINLADFLAFLFGDESLALTTEGDFIFESPSPFSGQIRITNDIAIGSDRYVVFNSVGEEGPLVNPDFDNIVLFFIDLEDFDASVFSDDSNPLMPPNLSEFEGNTAAIGIFEGAIPEGASISSIEDLALIEEIDPIIIEGEIVFFITPVDTTPVAGELLPIDSTALLLAGAQTNAVWIMSALAVIGSVAFGALYITSKKN